MNLLQTPWYNDPLSKKFSHDVFFGTAATVPDNFDVQRRDIWDQGQDLECAAYAGAKNGEYFHQKPFDPEWQARMITAIQGFDIATKGSNPNAAMKSQMDCGYKRTDIIDDPYNYHIAGYVKVDGPLSPADNLASAIYQAYDQENKRGMGVQAFGRWLKPWFKQTNISTGGELGGYHSWLFIGWYRDMGKRWFIGHNSWGRTMGDRGFQYFPDEVINTEFILPNTSLKIPKPLTLEQIMRARELSPWGELQRTINKIWATLTLWKGQ